MVLIISFYMTFRIISSFTIIWTDNQILKNMTRKYKIFKQNLRTKITQVYMRNTVDRKSLLLYRSPSAYMKPILSSWWRHQMETFSMLLALCEGNPPVTGWIPSQRPATRRFGVFFHLSRVTFTPITCEYKLCKNIVTPRSLLYAKY